jgi:hypothetical protein
VRQVLDDVQGRDDALQTLVIDHEDAQDQGSQGKSQVEPGSREFLSAIRQRWSLPSFV